eukprot:jgi/Tetstr1/435613/TSEL_024515.t1
MMVDGRKAAIVEGVETSATAQARIEAGRRNKAEDARKRQLIQELLSGFFAIQETPMPPPAACEENDIPGGDESRAGCTNFAPMPPARSDEVGFRRVFDGGGGNRENARPGRETSAPRPTFAKDVTKDFGKGKAKAEAPAAEKAE